MSLKLINQSTNRKTGGIATTYRAGETIYSTCPATCSLNPDGDNSAIEIDQEYLSALKLVELNKIRAEANSTEIYLTHYDFLEPINKT